jgi:hypothetical protein
MLNYFLLQLAGPQRKSLTVKDLENYEFRPKRLLKQVSWKILIFFNSSVPSHLLYYNNLFSSLLLYF